MDQGTDALDGEIPHALLEHLLLFGEDGQRRAGGNVCDGGGHGSLPVVRRRIISPYEGRGQKAGAKPVEGRSDCAMTFALWLWCPGPDSNRHAAYAARDFKSRASTNFATRASPLILRPGWRFIDWPLR